MSEIEKRKPDALEGAIVEGGSVQPALVVLYQGPRHLAGDFGVALVERLRDGFPTAVSAGAAIAEVDTSVTSSRLLANRASCARCRRAGFEVQVFDT